MIAHRDTYGCERDDGLREKRESGFTLIEILVAMFIFALVVPTIYGAYSATLRITSDAEYNDTAYGMGRSAMDRFIKDLESISAYQETFKFKLQSAVVDEQTVPMLTFTSAAHLTFSGEGEPAGIAVISYYVEKTEKGDYKLMRKDSLISGRQEDTTAEAFVVCENVKSLGLKFYDSKGQEYEFWDSSSSAIEGQKNRAPSSVQIDLQLVNPNASSNSGESAGKENPYRFLTRTKIGVS